MKMPSARTRRNLIIAALFLAGSFFASRLFYHVNISAISGEGSDLLAAKTLSESDAVPKKTVLPSLVINEVCAENSPLQCPLPEGLTLNPGEYLLVYVENDASLLPEGAICMDFQLKPGETVFLSSKTSTIDSVQIPAILSGTSYCRIADGSGEFEAMWPSPGYSNKSSSFPLEEPVFSLESGFYTDAISVTLSCADSAQIYYTLDGSLPTKNSFLYEEPLTFTDPSSQENILSLRDDISTQQNPYEPPTEPIDKAVVLRAAAIDARGNYSPASTAVYFIDYEDRPGYENVSVLSLVTEPESLFDEDRGIYVRGSLYESGLALGEISPDGSWSDLLAYTNYGQKGASAEKSAHVTYLSPSGELLTDQDGGIRIRGNQSRDFAQKSFTLYSRDCYGTSSFPSVFFETDISYSALVLNGSHTSAKTLIGTLVSDRSISTQKHEFCQVFLNGEYWGLYELMEKYDSTYIQSYYDVDSSDVLLVESTHTVAEGNAEDISRFRELRSLLEGDLSDPRLYRLVESKLDLQSLIDWLCTNIYVGNTDTKPLGENVYTWQSTHSSENIYEDGRWRWMLYDTDDSFCVGMEISEERPAWSVDSFVEHPGYSPSGFLEDAPMNTLMANEEFRRRFVLTFQDMANENFRPERVSSILDSMLECQTSWTAKSHERWDETHTFDSSDFTSEAEFIRDFFKNRFDAIMPCMAEHFSLSGQLVSLQLSVNDPEAGTLTLNTITPSLENGSWDGRYYSDYPVTLTASPNQGYVFAGWEITGGELAEGELSSDTISVQLGSGKTSVKACFEKTS